MLDEIIQLIQTDFSQPPIIGDASNLFFAQHYTIKRINYLTAKPVQTLEELELFKNYVSQLINYLKQVEQKNLAHAITLIKNIYISNQELGDFLMIKPFNHTRTQIVYIFNEDTLNHVFPQNLV